MGCLNNRIVRRLIVSELQYETLVWLSYRLGATFTVGVPLLLLIWSYYKQERSISRLLSIYWKVSSLMAISILFLISGRNIGYITSLISPFLMLLSIWIWIDLNEELEELPSNRPIVLTTRIWRWCLTLWGILFASLNLITIKCFQLIDQDYCNIWLKSPVELHQTTKTIVKFILGGNWTENIAGFLGYIAFFIYILGLLQWLILRLPKSGRIAYYSSSWNDY